MKLKLLIFFFLIIAQLAFSQQIKLSNLRCEYRINPIGIETNKPHLSWNISSQEEGTLQQAYQLLVSDNATLLKNNVGNVWSSGKISSSKSLQVAYQGKALEAVKTYYWKVKVWDNHQHESTWSNIQTWQMGLPQVSDWKGAKWIAYDELPDSLKNVLPTDGAKDKVLGSNILPMFRKPFSIEKPIDKATIFICGLGHFELSLNGKKVGNHFLDAGWTKYDKQALYVGFDLTKEIKNGNNCLGVLLGNGFYYIPSVKGRYRKLKVQFGYPKLICRLQINYKDGSSDNIVSDNSWKTAPSPITFSSIYGGEDYNANLEQAGWDKPTFDDKAWKQAIYVAGIPQLNSQMAEPLRVFDVFKPITKKALPSGDWVFDLGQNASGIIELKVKGHKGDTVRI
nr:family 78 glycoside hydrolase catalytic domain [Flectobacillus sp.]